MTEKAKLNEESLEKHFPKREIPRMHYDYDLSLLEYKPPILLKVEQAVKALNLQVENEVYKVVQNYEINVDKDELIKALRYDRNQYEPGHRAGYRKASEVAKEVIADIRQSLINMVLLNITGEEYDLAKAIAELKKKYTEGDK